MKNPYVKRHLNQIFSSQNTMRELNKKKRELEDTISIVAQESIKAKLDLKESMGELSIFYVELDGDFEGVYRVEKLSGNEFAIEQIDKIIIR